MSGTQQFISLICILLAVLAIAFLIMAPSIMNASAAKKNRQEP